MVVATHNRVERLARLLASLRVQTLPPDRFEVVVADDGSSDGTAELLPLEAERGGPRLRTVRLDPGRGPAAARNAGWRAATAPLVAFIDDDCEATPGWLEQALAAAARRPGGVIQGRTDPLPQETHLLGPFSRTVRVNRLGPYYQTCNIIYPRELLERLDGFDEDYLEPAGEDTDLAWRAIELGRETAFAPEARVFHAVNQLGPVGRLRLGLKWGGSVALFRRHPELRRPHLYRGLFWTGDHYQLFRAVAGLLLRRRLPYPLVTWLVSPYLITSVERCRRHNASPLLAPYWLLVDLVEVYAVMRASLRHRTLVL